MNVLLYFGSFNPIHNGHINLARYLSDHYDFDSIWFVVSPQNPLKPKSSLWDNDIRYNIAKKALSDYSNFFVSDIEFGMPQPNYTANTLRRLPGMYPNYDFSILIGEDNLKIFYKWFDYQYIIDNYKIYVYPRLGDNEDNDIPKYNNENNIIRINAPLFNISSTIIRNRLQNLESVEGLVPDNVIELINKYCEEGRI